MTPSVESPALDFSSGHDLMVWEFELHVGLPILFAQSNRCIFTCTLKKIFFSTFIYFWDRERQSMNGGGAEREGDTESETGSEPSAQSLTRGSNSQTARS